LSNKAEFLLHGDTIRRDLDILAQAEPLLVPALARWGYPTSRRWPLGFATLCRIIIDQQLSTRAAATIAARVRRGLGGRVSPAALLAADPALLSAAGLSAQKQRYLRALAAAVLSGELPIRRLRFLPDEQVVQLLTALPGFGPWSAQMVLLFSLGRADVWPAGDLGVQKGVARILGLEQRPDQRATALLGEAYRPRRSAMALFAWHCLSD